MSKSIWFMGGLSSQRDILMAAKGAGISNVNILASHPQNRAEILSVADISFIEPKEDDLLSFITDISQQYKVSVIHAGRNCAWFEKQREAIEKLSIRLITGAKSLDLFQIADNKEIFSNKMNDLGLPVIPCKTFKSKKELEELLNNNVFNGLELCVKPVSGIYGQGFWRLDYKAGTMSALLNPDDRRIHPSVYINALSETMKPQLLMPYFSGHESSIDMLVEDGDVIAAVGRRKSGPFQTMFIEGEEYELAIACASAMKADGLVNVQTKQDKDGKPHLLEINLRPSGGICYSQPCGISLPAILMNRAFNGLSKTEAKLLVVRNFKAAKVRVVTNVIPV